MSQDRLLNFLSPVPLLAAILVSTLFGQVLAGSAQPNTALTWDQKEQKSGVIAPKQVNHSELVSIAQRLHHLKGGGLASGTTPNHSSVLRNLVQSGALANMQFDTALSATRDWNIRWHEQNGTPIFVSNLNVSRQTLSLPAATTEAQMALSFLERYKGLFHLDNPSDELSVLGETSDKLGKKHIRLQQTYGGIPIWGHELLVHLEPDGSVYAVSARYCPTPRNLDLTSDRISADQAISVVTNELAMSEGYRTIDSSLARLLKYSGPKSELCIWVNDSTQEPHIAWFVELRPNIMEDWYCFVDVQTGELLHRYNNTNFDGPATASATDLNGVLQTLNTYRVGSTYYLIDASRPIWKPVQPDIINHPRGALWTQTAAYSDPESIESLANIVSTTNTWSDPVAVSAHNNAALTFQYYYSTFGRDAIDDSGSTVWSIIHVTQNGQSFGNAGWFSECQCMVYGDGDALFEPLAGALDIAAHEMTHGVVQHTANLNYENQSGALNESFADVFGCMVDRDDWLIGEDVVRTAYYPSGALRNLADPHNGGTNLDYYWQPAHMSEYQHVANDNGGVHINSGIPSRAAYLIGSSIGKNKFEQIYYRALSHYLGKAAQFIDMRLATIQSAIDLYGSGSTEVAMVRMAFDAVGILDGAGTPQPPDAPPVAGAQWIAVVNAEASDNSLYKAKPDSSGTIVQLSTTQVLTSTGCPMSVASDGSGIIFVDSSYFMRAIRMDGSDEQVISAAGEWYSVAWSPDGRKLAATTIYEDSSIYIFDLQFPDSTRKIHLYSPTTQEGLYSYNVRYADALDWNRTGEYLIYDALSSVPQTGGGTTDIWSIYLLDVADGTILSLYPPLPPGIQMGNPSFAKTNDIYIVCDLVNTNTNTDYIYAVNLFSGADGLIENNGSSTGFPDYSTDDGRIVFRRVDAGSVTLRQINVDVNRITPSGASFSWLVDATLPTWFVVPAPVDVTEPTSIEGLPNSFSLSQNYPNPFNPSTRIDFNLPRSEEVSIDVFNVLGQKVRTLVSKSLPAGQQSVNWDGTDGEGRPVSSGLYFYRLVSDDYVESKKMVLLK